jgi:hypothetical protein
MLLDLPELLTAHMFPFFLEQFDYTECYGYCNGNEDYKRSEYGKMMSYLKVCKLFKKLIHIVTRQDVYIGLCQYMYLNVVLPNTLFLTGVEDYEEGDPVTLSLYPLDSLWISAEAGELICNNYDIEGIAKILTLNKRYALGKIRMNSEWCNNWLPQVLDLLLTMAESDPQLSVNCQVIVIGKFCDACDDVHGGFEIDELIYENCLRTVTAFVQLIRRLSNNKCIFTNGLCCITCSEINVYPDIRFNVGNKDEDAICHFCSCPILPNFKCDNCFTLCNCNRDDYDYDREPCNNFVCNDCVEINNINVETGWRSPKCTNY